MAGCHHPAIPTCKLYISESNNNKRCVHKKIVQNYHKQNCISNRTCSIPRVLLIHCSRFAVRNVSRLDNSCSRFIALRWLTQRNSFSDNAKFAVSVMTFSASPDDSPSRSGLYSVAQNLFITVDLCMDLILPNPSVLMHHSAHLFFKCYDTDFLFNLLWLLVNLTLIELAMRLSVCVCKSTPMTADVTVTKIAGYVRVRILMNQWFFRIFGIHSL